MSVRTCTAMCPCGPNGELLRCGYGPGHKGDHSWATLPTFLRPGNEGAAFIRKPDGYRVEVVASNEWWSAVCSSLGEDYPHVAVIRMALAASPVPAVADDPACVCAMTSIRNCPVHGQGRLLDVPANKDTDE